MFVVHQNSIGSDKFKTIEEAGKHILQTIKDDWSLTLVNDETEEETDYIIDPKITIGTKEDFKKNKKSFQ